MHLEIRTWRVIFFEKVNQFLLNKVLEKKCGGKSDIENSAIKSYTGIPRFPRF